MSADIAGGNLLAERSVKRLVEQLVADTATPYLRAFCFERGNESRRE